VHASRKANQKGTFSSPKVTGNRKSTVAPLSLSQPSSCCCSDTRHRKMFAALLLCSQEWKADRGRGLGRGLRFEVCSSLAGGCGEVEAARVLGHSYISAQLEGKREGGRERENERSVQHALKAGQYKNTHSPRGWTLASDSKRHVEHVIMLPLTRSPV